jgi:hypothetical protein
MPHAAMCALFCRSPGLTGTVAVLAGHLLHLDPFGRLHWDSHDAALGLLYMLPCLLLGRTMSVSNTLTRMDCPLS